MTLINLHFRNLNYSVIVRVIFLKVIELITIFKRFLKPFTRSNQKIIYQYQRYHYNSRIKNYVLEEKYLGLINMRFKADKGKFIIFLIGYHTLSDSIKI